MELKQISSQFLGSNTYVLIKNGHALIIDSGANVEEIVKAVGKNKVLAILLTHGHYDHAFNLLELAKIFDCKIYASIKAQETLPDPAKNYGENFSITDFSSFIFLEGDQKLKIGDFEIEAFALPGHCKCCVGYLIGDILFSGDVLFASCIGRMDLFGSDKNEMLSSLKKLQNVKFNLLASGHGKTSTFEQQQRNLKVNIKFLSR